jgi:hypothetical protein
MFFFVRHQYITQLFVIRHSAKINECTLHNNGRKESQNIEERREEKFYVLTLTTAAKCFSNRYKEIPPSLPAINNSLLNKIEY